MSHTCPISIFCSPVILHPGSLRVPTPCTLYPRPLAPSVKPGEEGEGKKGGFLCCHGDHLPPRLGGGQLHCEPPAKTEGEASCPGGAGRGCMEDSSHQGQGKGKAGWGTARGPWPREWSREPVPPGAGAAAFNPGGGKGPVQKLRLMGPDAL